MRTAASLRSSSRRPRHERFAIEHPNQPISLAKPRIGAPQHGELFASDANSGQKKWESQTGDKIVSSPCPDHGRIYVGSDDGYLYALEGQ